MTNGLRARTSNLHQKCINVNVANSEDSAHSAILSLRTLRLITGILKANVERTTRQGEIDFRARGEGTVPVRHNICGRCPTSFQYQHPSFLSSSRTLSLPDDGRAIYRLLRKREHFCRASERVGVGWEKRERDGRGDGDGALINGRNCTSSHSSSLFCQGGYIFRRTNRRWWSRKSKRRGNEMR